MCVVVNKHYEEYDVYIGRGSVWGNPYSHKDGTKANWKVPTREEAIQRYRLYLWDAIKSGRITEKDLLALAGKRLGCFCKPQPCHGDVLRMAAEWAIRRNSEV